MQSHLMVHLKNLSTTHYESQSSKTTIINLVQHDNIVQFYWSIVNDIQNEEWSEELLNHLITSWLTIRGFSTSSQWMEEYKRLMHAGNKKKGLRKELQKISNQ